MSHYKPYPAYKDSGVEWLGRVPEHWSVKPLKLVAHVQTGIAKGKDNTGLKTIEVPYLRVANVQDGYLNLLDVATIEIPTAVLSRYLLQAGDVLMNEGGDFDKLGRGHVWSEEIKNCIHQNHVFAVRPHGVNPHWLNTFTGSAAAQFYFMCQSKQSTNLASISSSNLMELIIPLPPEAEVAQISSHLDRETTRIDTLIAKKTRFIELLKEKRQALIKQAVTKGLNPNVKMKDSGVEWLGEVPEHWEVQKTWMHFSANKGQNAAELTKEYCASIEGDFPVYSGQTESGGVMAYISIYEFDAGDDGYLLSTTVGAKAMSIQIVRNKFSLSQNCMAIIPSSSKVKTVFYAYHFSPLFSYERGLIPDHMQPSFRMEDFFSYSIAVPTMAEQEAISSYLACEAGRIEMLANKTELSITLLKERRSALITAAVTGQIDLREAA